MLSAVIADDLTGAADAAVEFAKRGYPTVALLDWQSRLPPTIPVVAADTESRHLTPPSAYERVYAAAGLLRTAGSLTFYKKIDSAIRGHLGAEIDAVLDATGLPFAVVAPAFPANGRVTVNGYQCDRGLPLEQTAFAQDPRWPVRDSHVPRVIAAQSCRQVSTLGLEVVRRGERALATALDEKQGAGSGIVVVDAETDDDLAVIAASMRRLLSPALAVGSAGLAEHCARLLPLLSAPVASHPKPKADRILIVAGSIHPRTALQVERAVAAGEAVVASVPIGGEALPTPWPSAQAIILRLEGKAPPAKPDGGRRLVGRLAARAREGVSRLSMEGLVLVGGDTAVAVLEALGARGIAIEHEVQPGVPAGRLVGGAFAGLPVVTKAGAFGDERALLAALAYLRGR